MVKAVIFGATPDDRPVHKLSIGSDALSVSVLTLGAAIQDVRLADVGHSLTLGFPELGPYLDPFYHAGTIMGPVANRIGQARAAIEGIDHRFDANFLGAHVLHSGTAATHLKIWKIEAHRSDTLELSICLPDGEGGFPGNRRLMARFAVDGASLTLTLRAETDQPTLMNLANHSYWNLGPGSTTLGHTLFAAADHYLPSDPETLIPTGEVAPVDGTRFDFRRGRALTSGRDGLLDLNLCLSQTRQPLRPVARLVGPTGAAMEMATTEPGLQVFDGHILGAASVVTADGRITEPYAALALEAQFWPDAPNHPAFPSIVLRPETDWTQVTEWRFCA